MRKVMATLLAAILFLDAVSLGVLFFTNAGELTEEPIVNETTAVDDSLYMKATVAAVGNNLIQDKIIEQAHSASTGSGYNFSYIYEKIAPVISAADVAVFTQESVVSPEHGVSGSTLFNSPAEIGDEMAKIGFNVVDIATNHALDYGEKGLQSTIDYWEEKGMTVVGAYKTHESSEWLTLQEVNGIKIAWMGFTESSNGLSLPDDSEAVLDMASYETKYLKMLDLASRKADVVIVCAHWGNDNETEVTDAQRQLASKLAEWGADVIIGSHPHVIQEAELLTNPDGSNTFVAYSLGNFLSAMTKGEYMLGGLLNFDIVKNSETGETTVENFRISGVVTHYGYNMSKIRVYPLSSYDESLASVHGVKERTEEFSFRYLNNILSKTINRQFLN